MIKREDVFKIGRLGKPHGVKGEISFQFDDDVFDRVDADYLFVEIEGLLVPFFMEEYRFRSDDVALMTFEGIDTEEKAEELTGCDVYFPRSLADDNDKETVSKAEIIGLKSLTLKVERLLAVLLLSMTPLSTFSLMSTPAKTMSSSLPAPN